MRVLFLVIFLTTSLVISISGQSDQAKQYFRKGTDLAKAEKYEKAIKSFQSSLKLAKKDKDLKSRILYNIGASFYQLKNYKKAEKYLEQSIKSNKTNVQAIYSLGLTQIELGNLNTAAFYFRKAISINDKHSEAWFDLGMVLMEQKNYKVAKFVFEKSIEYKTTRIAEAKNNLGVISAMQGDIELAVSQFRQSFEISNGTFLIAKQNIEYCKKSFFLQMANLVAAK